jgi:hypothetical protein
MKIAAGARMRLGPVRRQNTIPTRRQTAQKATLTIFHIVRGALGVTWHLQAWQNIATSSCRSQGCSREFAGAHAGTSRYASTTPARVFAALFGEWRRRGAEARKAREAREAREGTNKRRGEHWHPEDPPVRRCARLETLVLL